MYSYVQYNREKSTKVYHVHVIFEIISSLGDFMLHQL